jgi:hypothetical protein
MYIYIYIYIYIHIHAYECIHIHQNITADGDVGGFKVWHTYMHTLCMRTDIYIYIYIYIYIHTYIRMNSHSSNHSCRWGRFLAVGGFKQVFMVYNSEENRTEAVSVMDLEQMQDTGNLHVADMEIRSVYFPGKYLVFVLLIRAWRYRKLT